MERPLKDVRPIGPFTESLDFSRVITGDVDYTMLYAAPGVPSHVDASDEIITSFISLVEQSLRIELDLSESQYNVSTESIVAEDLRQDGNMLVVKLIDVGMNDTDAIQAGSDLREALEDAAVMKNVDGAVYKHDFFKDANSEKISGL